MGRRRKRRKKIPIRRPWRPTRHFTCPVCSQPTLTIEFEKLEDSTDEKKAVVRCGNCGLHLTLRVPSIYEKIDVYALVVDAVEEGRLEEYTEAVGEAEAEEAVGGEAESVEAGQGAEVPGREEV